MAAAAEREHAGVAAATTDDVQPSISSSDSELPLLVFHSHSHGMHMLSVSNQIKPAQEPGALRVRPSTAARKPVCTGPLRSATCGIQAPAASFPCPTSRSTMTSCWPSISKCLLTHRDPIHPECFVVILLLKNGM
ncbi:unnamed protein product [Urochloa humidicola]